MPVGAEAGINEQRAGEVPSKTGLTCTCTWIDLPADPFAQRAINTSPSLSADVLMRCRLQLAVSEWSKLSPEQKKQWKEQYFAAHPELLATSNPHDDGEEGVPSSPDTALCRQWILHLKLQTWHADTHEVNSPAACMACVCACLEPVNSKHA